jgi:hypothetical protein
LCSAFFVFLTVAAAQFPRALSIIQNRFCFVKAIWLDISGNFALLFAPIGPFFRAFFGAQG